MSVSVSSSEPKRCTAALPRATAERTGRDNARQEATARVSAGGVTVSLHVPGHRGNCA